MYQKLQVKFPDNSQCMIIVDKQWLVLFVVYSSPPSYNVRGCRGRDSDRVVVGFTTTNATSVYHH
jgi:hypothetical protein